MSLKSKIVTGKDAVFTLNGKKLDGWFSAPNHSVQEARAIEIARKNADVYKYLAELCGFEYGGCDIGIVSSAEPAIQNLPREVRAPAALGAPYGMVSFDTETSGLNPCAEIFSIDCYESEPRIVVSDKAVEEFAKFLNTDMAKSGRFVGSKQFPNATHCPKCQVPWKETPGFTHNYFDCPTCGGKKEDAR